jgi:hypothetical protein
MNGEELAQNVFSMQATDSTMKNEKKGPRKLKMNHINKHLNADAYPHVPQHSILQN